MLLCFGPSLLGRAEDVVKQFKKAIEKSTLDQPGTKPFHLKATIAPSLERDNGSHRTGTVEVWWKSPTQWRQEVSSPEFHQIAIVDGTKEWQKNDGDYFPEWLREISVALVKPVPSLDRVLKEVDSADVKTLMGQLHASWVTVGSDGVVSKGIGAGIALNTGTGLLFYGGDVGWDFLYADYTEFHNRDVARKVSCGSPEVTAIVTTLENLPSEPANFFDASQPGGDSNQIHSAIVEELAARKNLIQGEPFTWPPLATGPLEGVTITEVDIDREGRVRDVGTPVSDNPALNSAAREQMAKMKFKPYIVDGVPTQVVTTITFPFKTVRP